MRIKLLSISIMLLLLIAMNSCVDEYWPEVNRYENLLVVEGGITNEAGPYFVRLSKSSPIDSIFFIPYMGCTVWIVNDLGDTEVLVEIAEGYYESSPYGMQGEIGRQYKLVISTPERKIYQSDFVKMKEAVEIENVYAEVDYQNVDGFDFALPGYQFYVDTEKADMDTNYYMWDLTATYHYQSDYNIRFYYDGMRHPFNPADSLFNCWSTYKVKDIFTYNTRSLQSNKLTGFPLHFVSTKGRQLTKKYSLLVKQHTISKDAFYFWDAVEKQNSEQGSLYSHQPFQINGNIRNIDNLMEAVLGYFTVSSVDSMRIFVDDIKEDFYFSKCSINEGNYQTYQEIWSLPPSQYPIYVVMSGGLAVPNQACADCRRRGGTIIKPSFWED